MKHLIIIAGVVASVSLPSVAQPNVVGGPIQLRNPNRRGDDTAFPNGNGLPPIPANAHFGGVLMNSAPVTSPPPPAVAMFIDGPYLYVLRGDSLFQFDKQTLKVINSVELPRAITSTPATVPLPAPTEGNLRTHTSPPLRPGPNLNPEPAF